MLERRQEGWKSFGIRASSSCSAIVHTLLSTGPADGAAEAPVEACPGLEVAWPLEPGGVVGDPPAPPMTAMPARVTTTTTTATTPTASHGPRRPRARGARTRTVPAWGTTR